MKNSICFDLFKRGFTLKGESENLFVKRENSIYNFTEITICECSLEKVVVVIHNEYNDGAVSQETTNFYKMKPEDLKSFLTEHHIK